MLAFSITLSWTSTATFSCKSCWAILPARLQEAGAEQQEKLDDDDDQDGADMLVRSTHGDAGDDGIDETASQPHLCRRGDALQ